MREDDPVREASNRIRMARLIAGYGAIASAVPYLALKAVWLSGGTLGVANRTLMREPSMIALNAITAGMDLVGVALALAFTHRWGLRIPAWLLVPPMWVATGLLATFVVGVPTAVIVNALRSGSLLQGAGGPVEPWVYAVVYVGFAGQGIGLMAAFFLYARTRWADTLESRMRDIPPSVTRDAQAPLANAAATMASVLGVLHLARASGGTVGFLMNGIHAAMTFGAAAGVLMMAHRLGRNVRFWVPLTMAWVGAGSMFAWGLWQMINVLGQTALVRDAQGTAFVNLVGLFRLVVGLVIGLLTLFLIAERRAAAIREPPLPQS